MPSETGTQLTFFTYANDNDPKVSYWLSKIPIKFDTIDTSSITDVESIDLHGYTQCHFFSGIGGWPLALQLAGWPGNRQVWTGSCPCQPFSNAGKKKGTQDERHLWPEFLRLITDCKPATIFGEQVSSKAGRDWLSVVRTDLEALGYAVGAADLCAASCGAPHIRQRLFWVADSQSGQQRRIRESESRNGLIQLPTGRHCGNGGVADSDGGEQGDGHIQPSGEQRQFEENGLVGPWSDVEYIPCRDGKARPVKPGVRLLASGVPGRVAQLRGLGNAIVPQIAAEFVMAFMESIE